MEKVIRLSTPLSEQDVVSLRAGDRVLLSGGLITARDAAHKRLAERIEKDEPLPTDLRGQVIYYVGPTPPKPGQVIGSAGPTTSYRLDPYTPALFAQGLRGTIGKGRRSPEVIEALKRYKAVYFGATGGAAALLSTCITAVEVIAYEDLGTEAMRWLTVKDFPLIVINDCLGNDLYEQGMAKYRR